MDIDTQLKRYKKRNLKESHQNRLNCKVLGINKCAQQLITFDEKERDEYFNQALLDEQTAYPYYYADHLKPPPAADSIKEVEVKDAEKEEYNKWIEDRQKLKQELDKMDLTLLWLQNKPSKSALEHRVMMALLMKKNLSYHEDQKWAEKLKNKSNVESLRQTPIRRYEGVRSFESEDSFDDHNVKNIKVTADEVKNYDFDLTDKIRVPNDLIEREYIMALVNSAFQKTGCKFKTKLKRNKSSNEADDSDDVKLKNLTLYPKQEEVGAERIEMNLSTGTALIERKVDCWMTYEEFKDIIKNTNINPKMKQHRLSDNAFWPGKEDHTRICYPLKLPHLNNKAESTSTFNKSSAVFHNTRSAASIPSNLGHHNITAWPTDGSYVKYGDITRGKSYVVSHK